VYRTTANRLRRIAVTSALTVGASGGAFAATLTIFGTGSNGTAISTAIPQATTTSSKTTHAVVATTVPVAVTNSTAASAITSPSGTVSPRESDS
jgi:hypothetical protein